MTFSALKSHMKNEEQIILCIILWYIEFSYRLPSKISMKSITKLIWQI